MRGRSFAARNPVQSRGTALAGQAKGRFAEWGDDGYVPVICPTCQKVFAAMPETAGMLCMALFSIFLLGPLGVMLRRKFGS